VRQTIDILSTIALFALAVFVWMKWGPISCDRPQPEVIVQTDTIQAEPDTITVYKIPPPVIKYRDTTIYRVEYLNRDVDTAAILRDYFAKNYYSDITTDKKNYWIKINDTISQNNIIYRDIQYKDLSPTQIINNKVIYSRHKLFVGIDIIGGDQYFGFIPTIELKTKKDYLFGIGYDITNSNIQFSAKMKIFER
jgi:hypothetical protein